jgi:hypothetical protein
MRSRLFHAVVVLGASMGAIAGTTACADLNQVMSSDGGASVDASPAMDVDAASAPAEAEDAAPDASDADASDAADAEDGWQPTK